ncbi:GNAT family N-acetyltransferase [Glycomyces tritici]|uniref:GNAT family N-acetyltransferase n=1 Tax=Glycomyces tritici TaxID=2665176 RepID=A0ABT7YV89_9ACTN|nr:GNAT family N-acetyltransferase [Glycomyces tritici]MDN3242534.1 GNAT family N-acetyltransferase [Glycomyces tritici]
MIEVRALGAEDWRLWRDLRLAALGEAPYAFASRLADWQGPSGTEERWRARLSGSNTHDLVAEDRGTPVGMASGIETADPAAVALIAMWVAPQARGRGVGDALIAAVEQWARRSGARSLLLSVAAGNTAAAALYRRNGFRDLQGTQDADGTRQLEKAL